VSFKHPPDVPLESRPRISSVRSKSCICRATRSFDGNAAIQQDQRAASRADLGGLVAEYIVLGVSTRVSPIPDIISTLPSAGLGALLALQVTKRRDRDRPLSHHLCRQRQEERNHDGDFALDAERPARLSSAEAIFEACSVRFRPI